MGSILALTHHKIICVSERRAELALGLLGVITAGKHRADESPVLLLFALCFVLSVCLLRPFRRYQRSKSSGKQAVLLGFDFSVKGFVLGSLLCVRFSFVC